MPDDDETLDLPPLDGEDGDARAAEFDDPLAAPEDDGHDPLDDRAAEDAVPTEIEEDEDGESALDDRPADVEIEPSVLFDRLAEIERADVPDDEAAELDTGLSFDDDGTTTHDRGEEGFDEPDEVLDEAALPALDADEDGEADEGLFYEDDREHATDDLPFDRPWPVVAKAPIGEVIQIAVAGSRVDVRLTSGAALRSVDGGTTFAGTDLPPTLVPPPKGMTLRLPGERTVSLKSSFDRCVVVCTGPGGSRVVSDLSIELDADARDVAVNALAYDVGTRILWIGGRWGILGLAVPAPDAPAPIS